MSDDAFNIISSVIITTVFWLLFAFGNGIEKYRQGYAECKAGMISRWDRE